MFPVKMEVSGQGRSKCSTLVHQIRRRYYGNKLEGADRWAGGRRVGGQAGRRASGQVGK